MGRDEKRIRRVFIHLNSLCHTQEARDSLKVCLFFLVWSDDKADFIEGVSVCVRERSICVILADNKTHWLGGMMDGPRSFKRSI